MTITFTYFGRLIDFTGTASESLNVSKASVQDIRNVLEKMYPDLKQITYQLAENNTILKDEDMITSNKLDVFPPFSGG